MQSADCRVQIAEWYANVELPICTLHSALCNHSGLVSATVMTNDVVQTRNDQDATEH